MKNDLTTIEGFFRWASRHDMSIHFHTERHHRESEYLAVVMTCRSKLRDMHFARKFTQYDFDMNVPFSKVLSHAIIDYEMSIYNNDNEAAQESDGSDEK